MSSGLCINKIEKENLVKFQVPSLSCMDSHSMKIISLPANKINCGPFINDQVPSLIEEELPFNKNHQVSLLINLSVPFVNGHVPSLIGEKLFFNKCNQDSVQLKSTRSVS
jgi:hypothetical protein